LNVTPQNATGALLDQAAMEIIERPLNLSDSFVREALDVEQFIKTRTTSGGTAPQEVCRILAIQRQECNVTHDWLYAVERQVEKANNELEQAIEKLCTGP